MDHLKKYRTLKDHVYDYISRKIIEKKLKPGEKLNEKEICDEMGISRTPVREALIEISCEGYIEREPRKGFVVKEISIEKIKEVYEILGSLEALAIESALENMTKDDLSKMKKIVDEIDDAIIESNYEKYYNLRIKFHNVYICKSNNKKLISLIQQLKRHFIERTYNPKKETNDILLNINKQHKKIIELIEKKDKVELCNYIKNVHWSYDYAELDSFYNNYY